MPDHICTESERLERMELLLTTIHTKLFVSNGERALVEKVRDNTLGLENADARIKKLEGLITKAIVLILISAGGGAGAFKIVEGLLQ